MRKYVEYAFEEGIDKQNTAQNSLQSVSRYLKEEIFKDIYFRALQDIKFLKRNFSDKFLEKLSLRMKETVYGNEELIIKANSLEIP